MNAVNLLPARGRGPRPSLAVGLPFIGVFMGLAVVGAAAVLFVVAHNRVSTRRTQLHAVSVAAAAWSAAASRDAQYITLAHRRAKVLTNVRELVALRYHWSVLLSQLAWLLPDDARLASLSATTPTAAAAAAEGSTNPGIQLDGCAASHPTVAETMVKLRRITDVSLVTLSISTRGGGSSVVSTCPLPVQFEISLFFSAAAGGGSAATTTSTTAAATTTGTVASDPTGASQ